MIQSFTDRLMAIGEALLHLAGSTEVPDNLQARRVYTQLIVLRRVAYLVIGVIAVAGQHADIHDSRDQHGSDAAHLKFQRVCS